MRLSTLRAALTLLLIVAAARAQPAGGPPPALVVFDAARMERVESRREVRGELRATRRSLVASEEPGRVVELFAREGDHLRAGQPVARLDSTILALEAERAATEVRRAQAQLEERQSVQERADRDLHRAQSLLERASASQNEVDDKRSLAQQAGARVAQAEAELASARADEARLRERLAKMTIRAPFDSAVTVRRVEVGEWLAEGDGVVEVVETGEVEAWLQVSQQFIAAVAAQTAPMQIRLEATGETFEAPITAVIPAAEAASRMFPVRVRLANPEGKLRPGMSVVGLASTGAAEEALTVRKDAILRDDAGQYVYFSAGGVAAVARVETIFAVADRVVVRAPTLPPGAQVVVEGNERLNPGRPLAERTPAPAPTGRPG